MSVQAIVTSPLAFFADYPSADPVAEANAFVRALQADLGLEVPLGSPDDDVLWYDVPPSARISLFEYLEQAAPDRSRTDFEPALYAELHLPCLAAGHCRVRLPFYTTDGVGVVCSLAHLDQAIQEIRKIIGASREPDRERWSWVLDAYELASEASRASGQPIFWSF